MNFIWQSLILILTGIFLLRIAGRKSIAQMTLAQTVVMISLGTIIVQPIVEKSMFKAIIGAAVFVLAILVLEYAQVKSNALEKFITGKSKVVIENGQLDIKQLKKLRLTIDQLEMRLRNQGVAKLEHVKSATIEPNGQLGYELKESEKPLTIGEFKNLMNLYFPHLAQQLENSPPSDTGTQKDLFQEINYPKTDTPRYLQ